MKFWLGLVWLMGLLLGIHEAGAQELRANFRRISLDISSTEVSHAEEYINSPNAQLSADSQNVFKGVFDFVLENEHPDWQWNNSLFMEYGRTKLRPADGDNSTSENADKILLSSDYNRKMWKYEEADVGPFASLGYQTEFTANNDAPRAKILRGKAGIKLFNGTYIKELYAAAVEELDMTYHKADTKTAYEVGIRAEYPLREGVKFSLDSYFRDYVLYSRYVGTDFKYEFSLIARMDVKLKNDFSMGPYIQYFQAQAREAKNAGSNFMIGLSLSYASLFDI